MTVTDDTTDGAAESETDVAVVPSPAVEANAIEVSAVCKRFRKHSEPAKTLKERLLTLRSSTVEDFHALIDIDFDVKIGETFGILGHNGSGKSTLLKCIAGTIRPSSGVSRVRGRLSALLELGAGFHPDLTGRENIYLNGSILGFSKHRIEDIFDEIVEFSGLEEFIDTQVKHYSSGMYARLGFAVAVNVEPDVLLIDEVLAVGDEAFQRKCIERVRGFQAAGRTICLVTHSPEMVRFLCNRAMVLDHGHLLFVGDVNEAIAVYRRSLGDQGHEVPADAQDNVVAAVAAADESPVRLLETWVEPPPDGRTAHRPGDRVVVGLRYAADGSLPVRARLAVHSHDGVEMVSVSSFDITGADLEAGPGAEVRFVIDDLPFTDGRYLVSLVLQEPAETREYDRRDQELAFEVNSGGPVLGRVVLNLSLDCRPCG
jgi:ABC-2 type transport system ATP-binding protein